MIKKYFITDGTYKYGPFTREEILVKELDRNTKIWYLGQDEWMAISQTDEFKEEFKNIPPPLKESIIHKDEFDKTLLNKIISSAKYFQLDRKGKYLLLLFLLVFTSYTLLKFFKYKSEGDNYNQIALNSYETDENFEIYVEKFYRDLAYHGLYPPRPKNLIIKFSELDKFKNTTHIHAISFGYNDDQIVEIYINPTSWKNFNKPQKYFLMYHELAHDILNLKDLEESKNNYGKLMYPSISNYNKISMDDFINSYQTLFEELEKK